MYRQLSNKDTFSFPKNSSLLHETILKQNFVLSNWCLHCIYLEMILHVHEKGALYRSEDPLFVHRVFHLL